MFYALNENVYFVEGAAKGCIYDFNSAKLYSLNRALTKQIAYVNQGKISEDFADAELKKIFQNFIDLKILKLSKLPVTKQIEEIKIDDLNCKFAWIEVTNKCNLRCRHCYNESNVECENKMSLEDYKTVIDKIINLGVKRIQLIGGEPFIDKKILKSMLDYSIGKFNFIEIFTNGTLITKDWFKFLAENKIKIALSVYSYNAAEHDKVTNVAGSWKRTNETIAALKKHKIEYRVCTILMKDISLGERTGDLYKINDKKDVVRMSGRANFSLLTDDLIKKILITKKTFQKPLNKNFCKLLVSGHNCFRNKIYISSDLKVFPCVMERRLFHCTVNEDIEINLQNSIQRLNKDKIKICNQCEYRYACFDCRPNSLSEDIFAKTWYCTYNPQLGEWENADEFIANLRKNFGG